MLFSLRLPLTLSAVVQSFKKRKRASAKQLDNIPFSAIRRNLSVIQQQEETGGGITTPPPNSPLSP